MKKIFTFIISLAVTTGMSAQTVSPKAAAQKAAGLFLNKVSAAKGLTSMSVAEPELAFTAVLKGDTCFYVFNNPQGGYAIIGGDLAAKEVLATVDNGSFDVNTLNMSMKVLLSDYANDIARAKKAGISASTTALPWVGYSSVSPICQTQWDQQGFYSLVCPNECPTGCVATAAAQVLKAMPNHPSTGRMSLTYNLTVKDANGKASTQAYTYNKDRAFDWGNMLPKYELSNSDNISTDQGAAVALIMQAMGVMAKMEYSPSVSLADPDNLVVGINNALGIPVKSANRSKYTAKGWESLILTELQLGRPVVYGGSTRLKSEPFGHCFLVDGYDKNTGNFHINWGWSGAADGYYALTSDIATANGVALTASGEHSWLFPSVQGSGSTDSDYQNGNSIVYNFVYDANNMPALMPDAQAGGATPTQGSASSAKGNVVTATDATPTFYTDVENKPLKITFSGDGVENVGQDSKFVWGIELEPVYEEGSEPDVVTCYLLSADNGDQNIENFTVGEKVTGYNVDLSDYSWGTGENDIPYGKYTITPVMFYDGDSDNEYVSDEDIAYVSMPYGWQAPTGNFKASSTAVKAVKATSTAVAGTHKIYRNGHITIVNNNSQYSIAGQQEK